MIYPVSAPQYKVTATNASTGEDILKNKTKKEDSFTTTSEELLRQQKENEWERQERAMRDSYEKLSTEKRLNFLFEYVLQEERIRFFNKKI